MLTVRHCACLIAATLLLTSCLEDAQNLTPMGGATDAMMAESALQTADMASPAVRQMAPSSMAIDRSKLGGRRVAESHNMSIETKEDDLQSRFQRDFQRCMELECEILNSYVNAKSDANLSLRIDPVNLGPYLDFLASGPGEVKSHQVGAEDKTLQYIDTTARLENQEALRNRLRKMLDSGQAKTVGETLEIERELTRIQSDIDAQTQQKRFLERVTDKATVTVNYRVPHPSIPMDYSALRNSLREAWRGFIRNVADMIQFTGSVIPWIPVMFLGMWLVLNLSRLAARRRERRSDVAAIWRQKVAESKQTEGEQP